VIVSLTLSSAAKAFLAGCTIRKGVMAVRKSKLRRLMVAGMAISSVQVSDGLCDLNQFG
jgi:hypothetical protein